MGLVAWFPLNGTLKDLSPNNYTLTNTNCTVAQGNMGQCYSFATSGASMQTTMPFSASTPNFTCMMWIKMSTLKNCYLLAARTSTSGSGFLWYQLENGGQYFDDGTRWTMTHGLTANKWQHLCITRSTNGKCLYIDGVLIESTSAKGSLNALDSMLSIGWDRNHSGNQNNGMICDIRLYDHALSASEIYAISRGLCAHYTLDNQSNMNVNLVDNSYPAFSSVYLSTWYTVLKEYTLSSFMSSSGLANGDKITYSMYIKNTSSVAVCTRLQYYNTQDDRPNDYGNYINGGEEGWSTCISTIRGSYPTIQFCINFGGTQPSSPIYIKQMKVEKGTIRTAWLPKQSDNIWADNPWNREFDISGFGLVGTKTNGISYSNEGHNLKRSTYFSGSNIIRMSGLNPEAKTLSFWTKSVPTGDVVLICDKGSTLAFGFYSNYIIMTTGDVLPIGTIANYNANQWNHIVVVNLGSTRRCYINNQLIVNQSGTDAWSQDSGICTIGGRIYNNTVARVCGGYISDVRFYATPFSADDVAKLYRGEL